MTMSPSRSSNADAKDDRSDRLAEGGREMASVREVAGWNIVMLISDMMIRYDLGDESQPRTSLLVLVLGGMSDVGVLWVVGCGLW